APFSLRARCSTLAAAALVVLALVAALRLEGFDGNMIPRLGWRWRTRPEISLIGQSASEQPRQIDVRPTEHDFLGFLGTNRDAFLPGVRLSTDWKAQPPTLLWRQPIGLGWSRFAGIGHAAITLQQHDEDDLVTCYDLKTGKLQWFDAVKARHYNKIGGDGPGSTPTIHDVRIYVLGGTGVL